MIIEKDNKRAKTNMRIPLNGATNSTKSVFKDAI